MLLLRREMGTDSSALRAKFKFCLCPLPAAPYQVKLHKAGLGQIKVLSLGFLICNNISHLRTVGKAPERHFKQTDESNAIYKEVPEMLISQESPKQGVGAKQIEKYMSWLGKVLEGNQHYLHHKVT